MKPATILTRFFFESVVCVSKRKAVSKGGRAVWWAEEKEEKIGKAVGWEKGHWAFAPAKKRGSY